ncbi:MAG: DNA topoisomerase IV subunit A [Acholeplasmataceae bacterium]
MSVVKKVRDYVETIMSEPLEDIVADRFARYSKYIIQYRALPDARDGLKPVQRRILYAMQQMGMFSNKPYKKSARIAGEVMGKFHPHGDSSIYEAMVRLAQDFKMRLVLIDMHGNKGSIDGDSAAAMRYTEARLSVASEALLEDIGKRTVPFVPNFDDEELEPTVLPAKFPNLLVNGASGISSGYATRIPPHNLKEVIDATLAYIDNEEITVEEISRYIKGPDFPTGGIVQGHDGIMSALKSGSGKIVIRAKHSLHELSKSQDQIVIHEIPYEVNKAELVKAIDVLRIEKKVEDIVEIRDESDQEGMRIAIDLKKGANSQAVLNYLFKATDLQVVFNYNIVAILNHRPVQVGVIPILKAYVDHQRDVITNRSNYELEKATKRQHIVEGLIKMVSVVEEIIRIIRASNNKKNAKENIIEAFAFTEEQAEAIVTLQLYRLSNTDIQALMEENDALAKRIRTLKRILSSESALRRVIKSELSRVSAALSDERRTEIESEIEAIRVDQKELISDERVMIGISKDGYVKRASTRSYQASQSVGLKADDALIFEKEVQKTDTILIFTNLGNYIYLPVFRIDEQKWKDLGTFINNIVPIEADERIVKAITSRYFSDQEYLLLTTAKGLMKRSVLADFNVSRYNKPLRAMRLSKGDQLVSVDEHAQDYIIALSQKGYALRFKTDELPVYGLQAGGVKSMALSKEDTVAEAFFAAAGDDIVLLTIRGHIIKDVVAEIPLYSRNRRGILIVDHLKTKPHDVVAGSRLTRAQQKEDVEALIVSERASLKCNVSDFKYSGNKYGKKMLDEKKSGRAQFLSIALTQDDLKVATKQERTTEQKPRNNTVKEETVIQNHKRIRLSSLDLFDDDSEE